MTNKHKIRLRKTDSVTSVNMDGWVDLEIKSTQRKLHHNNISETVDRYNVFVEERDHCNKYRLILTINPYCTNVLFNPRTELFKYSPKKSEILISDDDGKEHRWIAQRGNVEINSIPLRQYAVQNTSYSSDEYGGYEYYVGYDIFNNHLLRSTKFKVINKPKNGKLTDWPFNTISDTARTPNGVTIKTAKRVDGLSKQPIKTNKHVYGTDDILSYDDSVSYNLTEDNGWFGFVNQSTLETVSPDGKKVSTTCRVLNNRKPCEFVHMYPDSTLYSFNPKHNEWLNRLEYNWDITLSYPYENNEKHNLVSFVDINKERQSSLKVLSHVESTDSSSENVVIIRSFVKHNLKRGDNIILWRTVKDRETGKTYLKPYDRVLTVRDVGDLSDGDKLYYFYIRKSDMVDNDINFNGGVTEDNTDPIEEVEAPEMRFCKVSNGVRSKYYLRKFRQIPNFKYAMEAITEYDKQSKETFENYVKANAKLSFSHEQYKLAFASTVFNDESTQVTFTDDIDVEHLRDNLGRPLSVIYVTIIKRNKGNDLWYDIKRNVKEYENGNIEFSHCFTEVTSGLDMTYEKNDKTEISEKLRDNYSVRAIYNNKPEGSTKRLRSLEKDDNAEDGEVKYTENAEDWSSFYGDLVELDCTTSTEYILSDVNYRFNTYQREYMYGKKCKFFFTEITADDEDSGPFTVTDTDVLINQHKEGYYYKAHNPIVLRTFGEPTQDSHYDLRLVDIAPIQINGMKLRLKTALRGRAAIGDIIVLSDDLNGFEFNFIVSDVLSQTNIVIVPYDGINENGSYTYGWDTIMAKSLEFYGDKNVKLNWLTICEYVKRGQLVFRRKNLNIPDYALKVGANKYIWRPILSNNETFEGGVIDYPFANGALYINKEINFYLKRQDKYGSMGLYYGKDFPNDISGETTTQTTESLEYKLTETPC